MVQYLRMIVVGYFKTVMVGDKLDVSCKGRYICISLYKHLYRCISPFMPIRSKGVVCYVSLGRCQEFVKLLHIFLFLETFTSLL